MAAGGNMGARCDRGQGRSYGAVVVRSGRAGAYGATCRSGLARDQHGFRAASARAERHER